MGVTLVKEVGSLTRGISRSLCRSEKGYGLRKVYDKGPCRKYGYSEQIKSQIKTGIEFTTGEFSGMDWWKRFLHG